MSIDAMKQALEALEKTRDENAAYMNFKEPYHEAITALRTAIEQAKRQQALDKMAENARELGLDYEPPRKTGSQCTSKCQQCAVQEPFGYFQYSMSIDAWVQNRDSNKGVAFYTTPPAAQRQWVDMPELELLGAYEEEQQGRWGDHVRGLLNVQAKLREKNGG